jgi:beta-galactosidase
VDRDTIRSGIRDVAHVTVEVVDEHGVVVPTSDALVEVSLTGPARVLAVGNGDPTDHTSYGLPLRSAFHGLLLAMVQSLDRPGTVRVTARTEGLPAASLDLVVIPGAPPPRVP